MKAGWTRLKCTKINILYQNKHHFQKYFQYEKYIYKYKYGSIQSNGVLLTPATYTLQNQKQICSMRFEQLIFKVRVHSN